MKSGTSMGAALLAGAVGLIGVAAIVCAAVALVLKAVEPPASAMPAVLPERQLDYSDIYNKRAK